MLALQHHNHSTRSELLLKQVRDLRCQALLHLRPPGKDFDETGQFGQSRDPPVRARQVPHMRYAPERQEVMFAGRKYRDIFDKYQFVVVCLECRFKNTGGIHAKAREQLGVSTSDAGRGLKQTVAVGVFAKGEKNLPDCGFYSFQVDGFLNRTPG